MPIILTILHKNSNNRQTFRC